MSIVSERVCVFVCVCTKYFVDYESTHTMTKVSERFRRRLSLCICSHFYIIYILYRLPTNYKTLHAEVVTALLD
jgi:hypothetical protein